VLEINMRSNGQIFSPLYVNFMHRVLLKSIAAEHEILIEGDKYLNNDLE
jgi:hypothetical protein